jgi:cell division protein ZapA
MPQVSIQIANRTYDLACGDGEEQRVQELARYVDEKFVELRRQMPQGTPEVKLMVLTALMLADESREARGLARQAETARASATDNAETLATALEELITARVDKMQKKVSGAA